jgi:hypothetical protein
MKGFTMENMLKLIRLSFNEIIATLIVSILQKKLFVTDFAAKIG